MQYFCLLTTVKLNQEYYNKSQTKRLYVFYSSQLLLLLKTDSIVRHMQQFNIWYLLSATKEEHSVADPDAVALVPECCPLLILFL